MVGGIENRSALNDGCRGQPVMNHGGGEKAESGMPVLFVVPGEEFLPNIAVKRSAVPSWLNADINPCPLLDRRCAFDGCW